MGSLDGILMVVNYAAVAFVPLCLFIFSYKFLLDPLRKYPGPFAAKFTHAYGGVQAFQKRLHLDTYYGHLKYGSVYRVAPDRLVFNTVTAMDDILLNPHVTKGRPYLGARLNPNPNLFDALDEELHQQKRKIIAPVLSDRAMKAFDPTAISQIDVFLKLLLPNSREGQIINMAPRCQKLAADVVGHLAFGYPLDTQSEVSMQFIPSVMTGINTLTSIYMAWPAFKLLDPAIRWLGRKRIQRYRGVLQKMIRSRKAMGKDAKQDLYAAAAGDFNGEERGLRDTELWSEATFFMAAGASTISSLMAAIFFYLARNSAVYAQLASEIRSTFNSGQDIRTGPELGACKYLRAVIDETLRISPASLGILWREQDRAFTDDPFIVDGHVIPRGIVVGISPYSLLHNEAYFTEPFSFRPERFLEDISSIDDTAEQQEARALTRHAFAPFAVGNRNCAGRALAYLEASLTIAKTLWYFDFKLAPGEAGNLGGGRVGTKGGRDRPDEYQLYDNIAGDHDGPNLVFTPRGDFWKELDISGAQ